MLQIASGKLFSRSVGWENQLRGVLYTNAVFQHEGIAETVIARLQATSGRAMRPRVVTCEFTERMEAVTDEPGVMVAGTLHSSGVEPYLQDISVVVSFALNCVCTTDVDLARRLTSGERGLATRTVPKSLVRRFFDMDLHCTDGDLQFLVEFSRRLIGLPRKTFLGVMRALRTYVNAMHRIVDDLELAYTLLVASVEALAQDFDGHEGDWDSVDQIKRSAVDAALHGADESVAQRVRDALVTVERVALARRFREFAANHTPPEYFRSLTEAAVLPLAKADMSEALRSAYQLRSSYVHQLKALPQEVAVAHGYSEVAFASREIHLTLQGLSRLMRNVIIEFVMRQPYLEREPHDYAYERVGLMRMPLDPRYWIGRTDGDIRTSGRDKLEGFLRQFASDLLREPNAVRSDMRPVLAAAAELAPTLEKRLRRAYLALHVLFNLSVVPANQAPTTAVVDALIKSELDEPCVEMLLAHLLAGRQVAWRVDEQRTALEAYVRRRSKRNGLRLPRLFEAALALELAERHRSMEDIEACQDALSWAVENHPGHPGLLHLEKDFQPSAPIDWRLVLLPPLARDQQATS